MIYRRVQDCRRVRHQIKPASGVICKIATEISHAAREREKDRDKKTERDRELNDHLQFTGMHCSH